MICPIERGSWGLIPFFPTTADYLFEVATFDETFDAVRGYVNKIAVIDDGSGLLSQRGDLFIPLASNMGKAGAIRAGLRSLLEADPEVASIVQIDYDRDQSPQDIPRLLDRLHNHDVHLVLGDRYAPHPIIEEYRTNVNLIQELICAQLGFQGLREIVTGLSVYTSSFAREFLSRSSVERWGLDAEKITIAYLAGMKVEAVPLTSSRNRSRNTLRTKLLDCLYGITAHASELRKKGKADLVDWLGFIQGHLEMGDPSFIVDLAPLGREMRLVAAAEGESYTLKVLNESE